MTPTEINKTSAIAKVRILVEQITWRLKKFQIISIISLLSHVNDILVVCSACVILKSHYIMTNFM